MHPHPPAQPPSVDIDSETVLLEGAWRTREELVQEIRAMLDAGNYGIARHSAALEALAEAMAEVRRVEFRATSPLAEDLFAAAAKEGRTPDALVRDAVARYLATSGDDGILRPAPEPEGRRETHPELRAVDGLIRASQAWAVELGGTWAGEIPAVVGDPRDAEPEEGAQGVILDAALQAAVEAGGTVAISEQLVTEPVSAEEAARTTPLEMKPKQKGDGEPPERRWFDGP